MPHERGDSRRLKGPEHNRPQLIHQLSTVAAAHWSAAADGHANRRTTTTSASGHYRSSRPSVQPPRLRPALRLLITSVYPTTTTSVGCEARDRLRGSRQQTDRHANRPTTTTSACSVTIRNGRPQNHDDCGLRRFSSRPSSQPPRLRSVLRLLMAAVCATTTTSDGWWRAEADCDLGNNDVK